MDSFLIERLASDAARSSSATWSTAPMRGSRGSSGSSKPPGSVLGSGDGHARRPTIARWRYARCGLGVRLIVPALRRAAGGTSARPGAPMDLTGLRVCRGREGHAVVDRERSARSRRWHLLSIIRARRTGAAHEPRVRPRGYLLPALAVALRGASRHVAIVAVGAVALAALAPVWNERSPRLPAARHGGRRLRRSRSWGARERQPAAVRAGARRPLRAGASCACSPRPRGSPTARPTSTRRCAGSSTCSCPDVADAAWVDVIGPGGVARRLGARVDGRRRGGARAVADGPRRRPARGALAERARCAARAASSPSSTSGCATR